ncbi:MAG: FAD-dependent oxidoreductase [Gammaproteobacteria bacterium]|nr:FAD-dependent oxidoreductase [Gammaproteobacteria bacterium]
MESYELIVIGSGPGGEKAALFAADHGHSVCVIDHGPAGGAWVNTGTIPSKTLRESALYLAGGRRHGVVSTSSNNPTVRSFMSLKRHLVARWRERIEHDFKNSAVTRICATARFIDAHTLGLSTGEKVHGERILIATGSSPRSVPELPVDGNLVHNSDTLLSLNHIPASMIVLGGGVIACEYASIFQALGVQVTLINGRDRVLGFVDNEMSDFIEDAFRESGMVVRNDARPEALQTYKGEGVEVYLDDGTMDSAEVVFVALGRKPATDELNLEAAGVSLTHWGTIEVNEYMQTEVEHIYAAGDVVGFPSLASMGMEQGREAAAHMFGVKRGAIDALIPNGVFTIPELSSVGFTTEEAIKHGFDPVCATASYDKAVRSHMLGENAGMINLVVDRSSHCLLGACIIGSHATELIHIAMTIIRYGGTVDDLDRFVFNVPTLSVLYKIAAQDVLKQLEPQEG